MEEKLISVNENTDITDENQSTNEDTQSENQETKITSIKLKRGKVFIVMWAVLATIFVAYIAVSLISYMDYRKAQDAAIEITLAGYESIDDDEFEEYKDDRAELCKHMYYIYNPQYFAFKTEYGTIDNSDVIDSAEELEKSLINLMSEMGYNTSHFYGSDYLRYTNYFEYAYNNTVNIGHPIYLIICFIALVITVLYLLDRKTKLTVQDDVVLLKKRTGKTVQFKIKDISSIESTAFKGLKLKGNAIKCKIILLKNAEEVRTKITQLISDLSSNNQDSSDQHLNETETIKQYKDLLDSGAITQEEFEAKKKQLLGL